MLKNSYYDYIEIIEKAIYANVSYTMNNSLLSKSYKKKKKTCFFFK